VETGPTADPVVEAAPTAEPTAAAAAPTSPRLPAEPSAVGTLVSQVTRRAEEVGGVFTSSAKAMLGVLSPTSLSRGARAAADFVRDLDLDSVAYAAAVTAPKSAFPMSLVLMVGAFLAIQNRIDRNDPKLALAPVHADRHLDFALLRPLPGGAR
jgi:hypothetical protein